MEAQDSLCAVIEAIIAVKENFKADYIIDILWVRKRQKYLLINMKNWKYSVQAWEKKKNVECCHSSGFDSGLFK